MAATVSTLTAHPHVTAAEERLLRVVPGPIARHIGCQTPTETAPADGAQSWPMLVRQWGGDPFLFPQWIDAWVANHQPRARIEIYEARSETRLIGAMPVIRESAWMCGIPIRRLRPPFSLASPDRFDIQLVPGTENLTVASIWNRLAADRTWDVLELVDLPLTGPGASLVDRATAHSFPVGRRPSRETPWLDLTTISDPFAHTTAKFRANVRRRRRNLEQCGDLRLVHHTDLSQDAMSQFLELEHSGWKGRAGTSILSGESDTMYHCTIAQAAADAGQLSIYSLELDGRPIAMHFGLVVQNAYSVPKLAYAEDMHEYAPGHILVHDVLADLLARGVSEFDFLGNQMDWKREWTPVTRHYQRVHIFNRTPAGLAAARLRYGLLPHAHRAWDRVLASGPGRGDRR